MLPKNTRNVRDGGGRPRGLPVAAGAERGVTYVKSFGRHRCDVEAVGLAEHRDARKYQWDNRGRPAGLLLQVTLEGVGRFEDLARGRAWDLPAGWGFLAELPSATRYGLPRGGEAGGGGGGGSRWRFLWVMLSGDAALDLGRGIIKAHGSVLQLPEAAEPLAVVRGLLRRLDEGRGLDELTANIEAHRLLLELQRALRPGVADAERLPEPVAAARRLIERRYADPTLGVDDLAEAAGLSKYHFSRLFRAHVGRSPYQHLLRYRVERALERVSGGDEPVKRIALSSGFRDVSWFIAAFRKLVRATPMQVRRQRRRLGVG